MGIVRNLANRISPAVKQLGDSLSKDYRFSLSKILQESLLKKAIYRARRSRTTKNVRGHFTNWNNS